jgi:hypothetical protein
MAKLLRLQWSPEQIAGRRKRLEDGAAVSSGLGMSQEAIYFIARPAAATKGGHPEMIRI